MKKKFLLLSLICVFVGSVNAQQLQKSKQFTLEQCLEYALNNSYTQKTKQLTETAKNTIYKQSKLNVLPSVSASLSESFGNNSTTSAFSGNYSINAGLVLYNGGITSNTIEMNRLSKEQASYSSSQYTNELTIQILQTFLTILGNEELLKYQQSLLTASEEQVKQGKKQFQAGSILESDYLMLEAQYASAKNDIVDTQITRDNNLLSMKSLLSIEPTTTLEIISPDTSNIRNLAVLPTQEEALENCMKSFPDLKISQYDVNIAEKNIAIARANYFPTVNLSGSIGTGHGNGYSNFSTQLSNQFNQQIGLSVSIPIYDKNETKSLVTQRKIALQQAELENQQTILDTRQTLVQEYQNVVSAYSKFGATEIKQNAYKKTFEAYRAKFNAGAITAVDLLQQQNNYISALNDYIQSKYSFILKRKILDVYMGLPVKM